MTNDRLSELNGRVAALSLVEGRIQHLASRVSVPDGAAMYRALTEVIHPERLKVQGSADEERAKREAEAALPQPADPLDTLSKANIVTLLEELGRISTLPSAQQARIKRAIEALEAAGL